MSLTNDERKAIVDYRLEKADLAFNESKKVAAISLWNISANRLYYALYYAVSALLIHDGHPVNTHRGVIAMFGNYYIRTGIFASEDGRLYSDLQTMRNNSDYNCSYDATQQEIEPMIEPAKRLIDKVSDYISK